jgi:lipopolysaccharide export system protein LptA
VVRALRAGLLVVLAGLILAVAASYGRREGRQAEITLSPMPAAPGAEGPVVDQSEQFEISGSREGRPAFVLRARAVAGFTGDRKALEGVALTLYDEAGRAITVRGARGQFDPVARRAQLAGDIQVESSDGLSLRTGTLFYDSERDVIFTADDIAFTSPALQGSGRGLNYLVGQRQIKIPDRVVLDLRADPSGRMVTASSGDLLADLEGATVTLTDAVRIARGGDVLESHYVKIALDPETHDLRELHAYGDVRARLAGTGGPQGMIRAETLHGRVAGPTRELEVVEASGGCEFISGDMTSRSQFARLDKKGDLLELRGEPVVFGPRDRIAAQEIDLHPAARTLQARGDVRTVSSGGGAPGFGAGSAVSFQAALLHADHAARRAVYSGGARGWQEGNSLQAESITLDDAARQLRATTRVVARFAERDPAAGRSAPPLVTVLGADNLILDEARSMALFRGNVRMTRRDATLTADAMDTVLEEIEGRRSVSRIEARGSVAARQGGSYGTARLGEYRRREDLLILRDDEGLAEVVDSTTGRSMRGRVLTFNLAEETILGEGAGGGRTWITLRPEDRNTRPGEPQTPR